MNFKDFFNKYKIVTFIVYALILAILLLVFKNFWVKLIFVVPLLVLGAFILFDIFPRRGEGHLTAVKVDGKGEIQITQWAIVRAVRNACKEIPDIRYGSCTVAAGKEGIQIRLNITIINAKVLETSELTRELVKEIVEHEMNVKIEKVDIVVTNTTHQLKVKKINAEAVTQRTERKPVYDENSPSYLLRYGSEKRVYKVPSNYIDEQVDISEDGITENDDLDDDI